MKRLAIDIETHPEGGQPDPFRDRLLLTGVRDNEGTFHQWRGLEEIPDWFVHSLQDPDIEKIFHYAKFDAKFLSHYLGGILIRNVTCTHAQERLLTSGRGTGNGLDDVALRRLGVRLDKEVRAKLMYGIVDDEVLEYHRKDIEVLLPIADQQAIEIKRNGQEYAARQENDLTWIVGQMEYVGIGFNSKLWWEYQNPILQYEGEYAQVVWDHLNIPYSLDMLTMAPTGGMSLTSRDKVLSVLKNYGINLPNYKSETLRNYVFTEQNEDKRKVVQALIDFKRWNKAKGWGYINSTHPLTQRMHVTFNPQGTDTSRFSSTDENLHSVTQPFYGTSINFRHLFHSPEMEEISVKNSRKPIVQFGRTRRPRKFVGADYSQIELRLLALFTQEPALVEAFQRGDDLHTQAAETVLGRLCEGNDRAYGKIVNFGVRAYGGGANALIGSALDYNILLSQAEAQGYVAAIRGANQITELWGKRQLALMKLQGFLQTEMGHRRWLEGEDRETVARNTPIQCVASEILKDGIRILYDRLVDKYPDAHLNLQVHDEVGVDCDAEDAEGVEQEVRLALLESGKKWMDNIPCDVETYISDSWEKN